MRNQAEIVEKIREYQNKGDFFGVKVGDAIAHLDFTHAKEFLKPEVTEAEWNNDFMPLTREAVLKQMEDYMPFAWEKANGMRGISANRSIDHMSGWLWLIGEEELINDIPYEHYGKEILIAICEKFGWDWKKLDDGERTNG